MRDPIFAAMRAQLEPSAAAQAALEARLERTKPKKERSHMWRYLAAAACAALSLCIYPLYNTPQPPALHSFVLVDGSGPAVKSQYREETTLTGDKGGGGEGPNTGDLPGEAYVGDVPTQSGVDAYHLLMDHFGGAQPDWYGGAYVTDTGALMVLLVNEEDPGDKTLELEVLEAVGDLPVAFTGAKYSRNDLERMNGELLELLDGKGIPATWGIYDDENRIVLDVSQPLPDDLLAAIAKIDPGDDAILIRVVGENAVVTPDLVKGPVPIGDSVDPVPGGVTAPSVDAMDPEEDPAPYFATEPGTVVPADEDLEAIEPYYDGGIDDLPAKLPGKTESAHHDLLPLE